MSRFSYRVFIIRSLSLISLDYPQTMQLNFWVVKISLLFTLHLFVNICCTWETQSRSFPVLSIPPKRKQLTKSHLPVQDNRGNLILVQNSWSQYMKLTLDKVAKSDLFWRLKLHCSVENLPFYLNLNKKEKMKRSWIFYSIIKGRGNDVKYRSADFIISWREKCNNYHNYYWRDERLSQLENSLRVRSIDKT